MQGEIAKQNQTKRDYLMIKDDRNPNIEVRHESMRKINRRRKLASEQIAGMEIGMRPRESFRSEAWRTHFQLGCPNSFKESWEEFASLYPQAASLVKNPEMVRKGVPVLKGDKLVLSKKDAIDVFYLMFEHLTFKYSLKGDKQSLLKLFEIFGVADEDHARLIHSRESNYAKWLNKKAENFKKNAIIQETMSSIRLRAKSD